MKKTTFICSLLLFIATVIQAQTADMYNIKDEIDSLKVSYTAINDSVRILAEKLTTSVSQRDDMNRQIREYNKKMEQEQVKAFRLCCQLNLQLAQGSESIDVIFSTLDMGLSMGLAASPFISPTYKNSYDKWYSGLINYIPAIAGAILPFFIEKEKGKISSVAVGLSFSGLLTGITNSNKSKKIMAENESNLTNITNLTNIINTLDLYEFNRNAYDDIQKIKSLIESATSVDTSLARDYKSFCDEKCMISGVLDDSIPKLPYFLTLIDESTPYFEKFELKVARVNVVLDYIKSVIDTYNLRYDLIKEQDKGNEIVMDTYKYIQSLSDARITHQAKWDNLQKNYYTISPEQRRTLQLFNDYRLLKNILER